MKTMTLSNELHSRFRDPVSGLTHLIAAFLAFFGLIYLLCKGWGDTTRVVSSLIYGISLVLMFAASAAYHLARAGDRVLLMLRKLDHSAIYLLIAGTYTPICLLFFRGFWRDGLLAIIWGMAVTGIIVKVFVIRAPRWVSAGIYLIMGWLCVMGSREILATLPAGALGWLIAGGLFYTIGAVVYITRKMDLVPGVFGFHEVWHIFVILGALSHYLLVAVFTI